MSLSPKLGNPYLPDTILSIIDSIQGRILRLQAQDYPTDTPTLLGKSIKQIAESVQEKLATTSDETTLQFCLLLLKRLGSHLQYIEAASADKIPWGLIPAIERMLINIVPDSSAMVCAQWEYNYSIVEIYDSYRKALISFLPSDKLQEILGSPKRKFFIVSVPIIECNNIFLHCVLGHEIGHRIADDYLDSEDKTAVLKCVTKSIGDGKWFDPNIDKSGPLFALSIRQELMSQILEIRRRGLQEITSDLCGLYLFGPAFLFALNEFAYDENLDKLPTYDSYYPPWRYRYRECLKVFDGSGSFGLGGFLGDEQPGPKVREAYEKRIEYIRAKTDNDLDRQAISGNEVVRRAYAQIEAVLPNIQLFVKDKLGTFVYDPGLDRDNFPVLLRRLAAGVPPNEGIEGPCDFRSAFTIGWLVRLSKIPIPFDPNVPWQRDHDLILARLVHKAIEYIEISNDYSTWKTQGST